MTVKEIVIEWLFENGFDGLCNIDCGCGIDPDEFMPCDCELIGDCEPAYLVQATESTEFYDKGEWIYTPVKEENHDAEDRVFIL